VAMAASDGSTSEADLVSIGRDMTVLVSCWN